MSHLSTFLWDQSVVVCIFALIFGDMACCGCCLVEKNKILVIVAFGKWPAGWLATSSTILMMELCANAWSKKSYIYWVLRRLESIWKSLPSACEEGKTQYLQVLVPFPKTSEWLQEGPMSSIQQMFGRVIICYYLWKCNCVFVVEILWFSIHTTFQWHRFQVWSFILKKLELYCPLTECRRISSSITSTERWRSFTFCTRFGS